MNYKAELRGFALDRAIRIAEVAKAVPGDLFAEAEKIADYLYVAEKDLVSHLDTLFPLIKNTTEAAETIDKLINLIIPLIRNTGDAEKLGDFILALQQEEAELKAGLHKPTIAE